MGNELREGREIVFADGQTRKVYPLTIRQLRKFLRAIAGLNINTDNLSDEDIDKMVSAASIVLEREYPDVVANPEALEDIIDLKSFNELLSTAMGADPNV